MTKDRQAKRAARQRAVMTGEPYALARRTLTVETTSSSATLTLEFHPSQTGGLPSGQETGHTLAVPACMTLVDLFHLIATSFPDQHPDGGGQTLWLADGRAFTAGTTDSLLSSPGASSADHDRTRVLSVLAAGDTALYSTVAGFVRIVTVSAEPPPADARTVLARPGGRAGGEPL